MTTIDAQPVTGQDINLAARATRKALEVVLAEQASAGKATPGVTNRPRIIERDVEAIWAAVFGLAAPQHQSSAQRRRLETPALVIVDESRSSQNRWTRAVARHVWPPPHRSGADRHARPPETAGALCTTVFTGRLC